MKIPRRNWLGLAISGLFFPSMRAAAQEGSSRETSADPMDGYTFDLSWPKKPADIEWGQMPGVYVDGDDLIYLFTRNQPAVQIYRPDGTLAKTLETDCVRGAHYIRTDQEGNLWGADFREHVIQEYSKDGKLLLTLGTKGESGSDASHLKGPTDMAILPGGDIFVSDGYGNQRVIHFDKSGKFLGQWGTIGDKPGEFALPHAIVADSKQRLYVADRENSRIQVFTTDGTLLAVWEDTITPWGLFITAGDELWVCGSSPVAKGENGRRKVLPPPDQIILKLSTDGEVLRRIVLPLAADIKGGPGLLSWLHGIGVDSKGNIYVGDIQGRLAQKLVPSK